MATKAEIYFSCKWCLYMMIDQLIRPQDTKVNVGLL